MDQDIAPKLVDDDERLAVIVIEFLAAVPSPSGGRFAAAGLFARVVVPDLGRGDEPKFSAAAVRAVRICRRRRGHTAQGDGAGGDGAGSYP